MSADLVLLHGWALTRQVWEPVIPGLSRAFRVHNLALPGYGGDEPGDPGAGRGTCTARELLDQWSNEVLARAPAGAIWMGWSLGAMVVMNAVRRSAGAIRAAVLVAATPRFVNGGDWDAGMDRALLRGFVEGIRNDDAGILKRFVMLQAGGPESPREVGGALMPCLVDREIDSAVLEAGLEVLEQVDLRPALAELDVPVLVVHGSGDRIVPHAAGAFVAGEVPRGELVTLDTGHAPFVSRPRAFAEAVLSWT